MTQFWLPVRCVICGEYPSSLCQRCEADLALAGRKVSRDRLVPGLSCVQYSGAARELVLAFKQSGSRELARLMARSMAEALVGSAVSQPLLLIPAPSRRQSMVQRGFVPAAVLAGAVARCLQRSHGVSAAVVRVVKFVGSVADQAGLNRVERATNIAGQMLCLRGPSGVESGRRLVLLDDVVTTGSTLSELQRCLTASGWKPESFLTFAETLPKG